MMKSTGTAVGIVDWGIGGTSVYQLIKAQRPNTPFIYFSDTGVTPYGRLPRTALRDRLQLVIKKMASMGVTHLVIGCNAASTAIPDLDHGNLTITGVIEPAVREVLNYKIKTLGIIGGRRTITSQAHAQALRAKGITVKARVAQPLSALIEKGDLHSDTLHDECRRILTPLHDVSHLLIACTHYPAVLPVLQQYVSPKTVFIDPAPALVRDFLKLTGLPGGKGPDRFLTSGDPNAMQHAAKAAFGIRIKKAERVNW